MEKRKKRNLKCCSCVRRVTLYWSCSKIHWSGRERESDFRGRRGRKREKEKERKRTESVTQDRHNDENKKTMDKKRNQNRETWISVLFRELFEFGWKLRRSWKASSIWRFGFLENFEGARRLLQRFQISADVPQTVENKLYSNSEHF